MRPGFRRRSLAVSSTACSALFLALFAGGCGATGADGGESATTRLALPAALADELARRADRVAVLAAAGAYAEARATAIELRDSVVAASDDGRIPAPLAGELLGAVDRLLGQIPVAEETPPEEDEKEDDGDDKGNGKGKGKDEGKDEKKGETTTAGTTGVTATTVATTTTSDGEDEG